MKFKFITETDNVPIDKALNDFLQGRNVISYVPYTANNGVHGFVIGYIEVGGNHEDSTK